MPISGRPRLSHGPHSLIGFSDARANCTNSRVGWKITIDPKSPLSMRVGGKNRSGRTTGGGSRRDDLSSFGAIAVEF